ncbi:cytochrome P450 [Podospora australis]|uniref:Cytochrome P450 n=1 Tax=Podospora australis TaxID=1536484 RepID=A0AAN6WJG5_9PEZI|nr:cytochrome P450 [Podospora australis]
MCFAFGNLDTTQTRQPCFLAISGNISEHTLYLRICSHSSHWLRCPVLLRSAVVAAMATLQDIPARLAVVLNTDPEISSRTLFLLGGVLFLASLYLSRLRRQPLSTSLAGRKVPQLDETVPYVSNTWQFLTNHAKFLNRVSKALTTQQTPIIKFTLGPFQPVYVISGPSNVQRLFGSPEILDGDWVHFALMEKQWDMSPAEMFKFRQDTTGRHPHPLPGSSSSLNNGYRYWRNHNLLYTRFLTEPYCWVPLVFKFCDSFTKNLDSRFPLINGSSASSSPDSTKTQWEKVSLFELLKQEMASAAIYTLFGSKIFDLNPGFMEAYWDYDKVAGKLIVGFPPLLQPKNAAKKERLHSMVQKHIVCAWESYPFPEKTKSNEDEQEEVEQWDPHFGSRLSRESAIWLRSQGFSDRVAAGHTLATLFGLNGNTVPVTIWALIELLQDPSLLADIREEIRQSGCISLPSSSSDTFKVVDVHKVVSLPLLQSVYVEIMRMHVSFAVTRQVRGQNIPVETILGTDSGYRGEIEAGALLQTLSRVAHFDEEVWGVEGHPATEFYGYRHVKNVKDEVTGAEKMVFAMKGRPNSFFAYGGGYWICPGRHFGKMEIMLTLALMVMKFEMKFVEWMTLDGKPSDRAPEDDELRYAGSIAMFPDRDVKVRLRRVR